MNIVDDFIQKLAGVKPTSDRSWKARCPAHDDDRCSLVVSEGDDGRVLAHCHAGCTYDEICDAIGVRVADTMPECNNREGHGKIVTTYDYRDESGKLLYQSVRYEPKDFKQRRPAADGGWDWNMNGVRYVLYQLPELRADDPNEFVFVCEGEKDADNLRSCGVAATTNVAGARKWRSEYNETLRGRNVIILPDNDATGQQHALMVAAQLHGIAASVRILELPGLPEKGDVSDWFQAGGDADQLNELAHAAALWQPAVSQSSRSDQCGVSKKVSVDGVGEITLLIDYSDGKHVLTASCGANSHTDKLDAMSADGRSKFLKAAAAKFGIDAGRLSALDCHLVTLAKEAASPGLGKANDDNVTKSQATLAIELASSWELFHTKAAEGYTTIEMFGHFETHRIKSMETKRLLRLQFFGKYSAAITTEATSAALEYLEAKAFQSGAENEVHVRVAGHDSNVYLDLCDRNWNAVEITPDGWQVISNPPVKFRRAPGMYPLPVPERGGSIQELRRHVNVTDESWPLVLAYLVGCLQPWGPFPIAAIFAEQGSGKSTTARRVRDVIDPGKAALRSLPREERDLMIAANNSWMLAFDNLSGIPVNMSDAMCRLSTGGGFAVRENYSDSNEILFDAKRPQLITSIDDIAERGDFLDRCLIIRTPTISDGSRRSEHELDVEFNSDHPKILGAILDAVSTALRRLPTLNTPNLPRLADFARWVIAAEPAFSWDLGSFMAAYAGNREAANDLALEGLPVAKPIIELVESKRTWTGTATELLQELNRRQGYGKDKKPPKGWPTTPSKLSGMYNRLAPHLRSVGIVSELHREGSGTRRKLLSFALELDNSSDPSGPFGPAPRNHREKSPFARTDKTTTDRSVNQESDHNCAPDANERASDLPQSSVGSGPHVVHADHAVRTIPEELEHQTHAPARENIEGSEVCRGVVDHWGETPKDSTGKVASPFVGNSARQCNHRDQTTWVRRDGKAYCSFCDRFIGRYPKRRSHRECESNPTAN